MCKPRLALCCLSGQGSLPSLNPSGAPCVAGLASARSIEYDQLAPFANLIDIRGIWTALKLPQLPETFCHIGVLGWHCHNTTLHPWDPKSLIPKENLPPMPKNATCIICPDHWEGQRGQLISLLLDLPTAILKRKSASIPLPQGMYNMTQLVEAEKKKGSSTSSKSSTPKSTSQKAGSQAGGKSQSNIGLQIVDKPLDDM